MNHAITALGVDPIDAVAIEAFADAVNAGEEVRIDREGVYRGFRWALLDAMGHSMLVIKAVRSGRDGASVGILRMDASCYLEATGGPSEYLIRRTREWLQTMNVEQSKAARIALIDIVCNAWPDWYLLSGTPITPTAGGAFAIELQDENGRVLHGKVI